MQSKTSHPFVRAGLAATAVGTLLAGSALFATSAFADVTGFQTNYQYTQGLAIGAGGRLESGAAGNSSAVSSSNTGTAAQSTVAPTTGTGATSVTAPATAPVTQTSGTVNTAQAPAAQTVAQPAAATGLSQPLTIALWVVIGLAAIALLGALIAGIVNANREASADANTRRRVSYQS